MKRIPLIGGPWDGEFIEFKDGQVPVVIFAWEIPGGSGGVPYSVMRTEVCPHRYDLRDDRFYFKPTNS